MCQLLNIVIYAYLARANDMSPLVRVICSAESLQNVKVYGSCRRSTDPENIGLPSAVPLTDPWTLQYRT